MKKVRHPFVLALLLGATCECAAYELSTHGVATLGAYERSILARDPRVAGDLGLDTSAMDPFDGLLGPAYWDGVGDRFFPRQISVFEQRRMPNNFTRPLSIAGWLIRGAIREDDLTTGGCVSSDLAAHHWPGECNPQDDPYGNSDRVFNHFFDPYLNRGLISNFGSGTRAPDWATGAVDAFLRPNQALANRTNHFTLMDARQAMYYALTGRGPDGAAGTSESTRKYWWATAFRSLGDVLHLVQDMAQPQHTRIATHPGSVFERYIDARAQGKSTYTIDGASVPLTSLPSFNGFAGASFDRYSDFWSTASGASGSPARGLTVLNGLGLADYSTRGFFAEGSNLGSPLALQYPGPSNNPADYNEESVRLPDLLSGTIPIKFLKSRRPETSGMRATSESALSRFLPQPLAVYTMNRYVFDDQVERLVPQAIRYSWGMLDRFFRGRIDCKLFTAYPTNCLATNLGAEAIAGTFELFYDAQDGTRQAVAGSRNADKVVLAPHGVFQLAFSEPAAPAAKKPGEYMLVFNGDMGQELADEASGAVGAVLGKIIAPRRYLAAGLGEHNLLADDGGGAWAWGDNEFAQLGNGGFNFVFPYGSDGPIAVLGPNRFPPLRDVAEVAKGAYHSMARKKDGTLWTWGNPWGSGHGVTALLPRQVSGLTDVATIAGGGLHSLVVRRDGSLWSWGYNDVGQLGNGTIGTIANPGSITPARLGLAGIRAVAAGEGHSVALKSDGTVWAWGSNAHGEVGNGAFQASGVPAPSQVIGLDNIIAVAAGAYHGIALKRDGTVWSWGANFDGQLGDGSVSAASPFGKALPVQVSGLTDVVAIAAGGVHSIAARRDGTVWTWGDNLYGQLGNGTFSTHGSAQPLPVKVSGVASVVEVSGGYYHSLALKIDGTIWAWGRDWYGELGDGTTTTVSPYGKSAAVRTLISAF